jgi:hypothetical protein
MRKLLLLMFLTYPVFAGGPKYTYKTPPGLDDEMSNLYHDIKNPIVNNETVSTGTATNFYITQGSATVFNIGTSAITLLTASSGTIPSFMVTGTVTNDSAPTGRLGQIISCSAAGVSCANTLTNICSLTLTPGDWNISALAVHNGIQTILFMDMCVSANSASFTGCTSGIDLAYEQQGNQDIGNVSLTKTVQVSSNTTYFLVVRSATTTDTYDGSMYARRMR